MTMLDRYLLAVRTHLPKDQPADDICAEIAESLHAQIEDREAALNRSLSADEEAAIIKAYGHPQVVAARYGTAQYLIGPALLPFYWSTLRAVLAIVVAIELVAGMAASLARGDGTYFFAALNAAFASLVWVFTIVTIVFALGERYPQSLARRIAARDWDPRSLPGGNVLPAPRTASLAEFIANALMLLVLLDARGPHHIPLDAIVASAFAAFHAALTGAWMPAYIATATATAVLAVSALIVFLRPRFSAAHEAVRGVTSILVAAGIALTLQAGRLIAGPDVWNTAAVVTLVLAIVILLVQAAHSLRALVRPRAAMQQ